MVSEFDNLKNKAEQYAQQHPEQIREGEEAIERKLGLGQQGPQDQGDGQGGPQDQYGQGQQGQYGERDQGNYGQGGPQDQYGQGQQDQYGQDPYRQG